MPTYWNVYGRESCMDFEDFLSRPNTIAAMEIAVRICLMIVFCFEEFSYAYNPVIQPEDMWRHRYHYKESTVPFWVLLVWIAASAFIIFSALGIKSIQRNKPSKSDTGAAVLGMTLSLLLTCVITNFVKSAVGRPRPNYLTRCYGDYYYKSVRDASKPCTETGDKYGDLHKSFPSGHSSAAFSGFGYLSLYVAGKLGTFNVRGRGVAWRLVVTLLPTMCAVWVALTRYTDYHHHIEDILAGSLLGSVMAYLCYAAYFKPLSSVDSHQPLSWEGSKRNRVVITGLPVNHIESAEALMSPRQDNWDHAYLKPTDGMISMTVKISRNRPQLPADNGNDSKERVAVAFQWENLGDKFVNEKEFYQMRAELLQAMDILQEHIEPASNTNVM